LTLEQYPVSGMGYYRYYWSELEPSEGEYNFSLIDDLLEQNAKQSKRVALRFMTLDEPFSGTKIPQWLIDKGIEGQWVENGKTFVADLDDPTYLYYVE
ncbi:beta-galactosidase, partial [Vibrio sp. F13]